jgi:hypothetical protein
MIKERLPVISQTKIHEKFKCVYVIGTGVCEFKFVLAVYEASHIIRIFAESLEK